MKKVMAFAVLAVLLVAGAASAAEQAVTWKSGDEQASGVLVTPEGKGPFPAVVVIQEWWGLNDWVKDQARALAKEGYVALAVDLYRGKVATQQEDAHQLMMGLPPDRAIRDLQGRLRVPAGARRRAQGPHRRRSAGAWAAATRSPSPPRSPTLGAVVAYYGAPPTDLDAIGRIKAPVLGNYGGEDKGPSPEQVRLFEDLMKKAGKPVDVKIYPGAGHAFANVNNPWGGYRKEAAEDAWARTKAFLAKYLKA